VTISWLLFSFQGRISRKAYWFAAFIFLAAQLTAALADRIVFGESDYVLSGLTTLVLLFGNLAVGAKRFHDRGKSAWWLLIGLVPLIGWIWVLIENGFLRGEAGPNRFGPDPLDGSPAPGRF
jgi:uncharacterized membrane protein YhaH (DUF805 family)